ncbi:MAG: Maf family protein [Dehalococcoidia bacterium]
MSVHPDSIHLILASGSPRRRELLAALAVTFDVRPTDADETVADSLEPEAAVMKIARRKLHAASQSACAGAAVIVADTIVALDGRIFGKPANVAEARTTLRALRGRVHDVLTAVLVAVSGREIEARVRTQIHMRRYADAEIEATIAAGTPFDKAGSYAIQDPAFNPVERFEGCYCNVMGLPLWSVYDSLRELVSLPTLTAPDATFARCGACPLAPNNEGTNAAALW